MYKPRRSFLFLAFYILLANNFGNVKSDDCNPAAASPEAKDHLNVLEKGTAVLEKLTDKETQKTIRKTLTSLGKHASKICSSLPLVGAGFAVLGAVFDVYGPKEPSDELQCMKQEFAKIQEQFTKITTHLKRMEEKVDQISAKLDEVINLLEDQKKREIQTAYNKYFKEPIRRNYVSYQTFANSAGSMNTHNQGQFLFSCKDDQPLHALDWLNRTVHQADLTDVDLMDHIFGSLSEQDTKACDNEDTVLEWFESIFTFAGIAATMDVQCYAVSIQQAMQSGQKAGAKSTVTAEEVNKIGKSPIFGERAGVTKALINDIKRAFEKKEAERQKICFEKMLQKISDEEELKKEHLDCTCQTDYMEEGCSTAVEKIQSMFDQIDITVCILDTNDDMRSQAAPKGAAFKKYFGIAETAVLTRPLGPFQYTKKCDPKWKKPYWIVTQLGNDKCKAKEWDLFAEMATFHKPYADTSIRGKTADPTIGQQVDEIINCFCKPDDQESGPSSAIVARR